MTALPHAADQEVLNELLEGLARFGAHEDGITRLVYDPAWCAAQRWLAAQASARGLKATADWAGNLLFHDPTLDPRDRVRPAIVVGSHLDSVMGGGRFDGAYGTVAGLLIAAES